MKLRLLLGGALLSLAAPLFATDCIAGTSPANALNGQSWAFRLVGQNVLELLDPYPDIDRRAELPAAAAIGVFTAHPGGYLALTETVANYLSTVPVMRMVPASGRWMVNPDCKSGMLWLNVNRENYVLNFAITEPGRMELGGVHGNLALPGDFNPSYPYQLRGFARVNPPKSCPTHITNPLSLLDGVRYRYVARGGLYTETGTFTGSFPNPFAYSGNLVMTREIVDWTAAVSGSFLPNFPTQGRYIIYPDCSGGQVLFNVNNFAAQLEFVFSKADFSEMFLLSDQYFTVQPDGDLNALYPSAPFAGIAVRE